MINRIALHGLLLLAFTVPSLAQVRLPKVVSDGMVLQRNAKTKIWGWASPGEKVAIHFNGKTYRTRTGTDGKWQVALAAMKAGGPYTMYISASNKLIVRDILLGDVWLCSGQSNMQTTMERVSEKYPDEIPNASNLEIRQFLVPTLTDPARQRDDLPPVKWQPVTPGNVPAFSAVAYFFAKALYQKYHVPIGIINAAVGGTPIEAWTSEQGFKSFPEVLQTVAQLKDTSFLNRMNTSNRQIAARAEQRTSRKLDKGLNGSLPWYDTAYRAADWKTMMVPGYWADQGIKNLNGVVWYRKEIVLPASFAGQPAKLYLGRIVDADEIYVNGVLSGSTGYQYPPRRYALPAGRLKAGKNVIVVRVTNTAGKGGFVPDKPYYLLAGNQKIDLKGEWQYKVGQAFEPDADAGKGFSLQNQPTVLYNAMIAPLVNYTLKGMIWYQGESNSQQPQQYAKLLPNLIADWRSHFKQGTLPFLYVQLPNYNEVEYLPGESKWAEFRESQLKALQVPNTAMAVAIDCGEWNDIHPLGKKPVGERLALAAQHVAYGDNKIEWSGPIYQSANVQGNKIVITFSHTGSGLVARGDGELKYFAIAGADKKFVWAQATIEGNKVVVWHEAIKQPLYVRYAWAENSDSANLYNREGLPASPFRTDTNP
ncbi:sialate O-acetylesterase [Mucilaginibacter sp. Bleaf8]|uniref:sialate O-acetylesterase n=1 Tax=Mucilaginibacter sp. Bleaf8 TaxID=2834430 RepID=UPI001BCE12EA|nr:sialate O-acetylesterase [Mucilaginibacter sp. Bleaf8]MBS7565418.1 sialate O-acetylesterase [Mucilaginibacter sp. Bleaf8]